MKLKTATLLACITTGIALLMQTYALVRYHIIERGEYTYLENDIYAIIYLILWLSLFIFFITYYQKQNTKSWKD